MARYYYTDVLKAAWMMREHGIKLIYSSTRQPILGWIDISDCVNSDGHNYINLIIDTESYDLLKPRDGDIGSDGTYPARFEQEAWRSDEYIDVGDAEDYKIIERNEKAWFTPEVEGD